MVRGNDRREAGDAKPVAACARIEHAQQRDDNRADEKKPMRVLRQELLNAFVRADGTRSACAESAYRARECDREEENTDRLVKWVEMPALGRRHVESGRDQEQDRDANGPVEGDRGSI